MEEKIELSSYQKHFIDFLIDCEVLTFGDFTTKSGRRTPYFVNTGKFNSGARIARLGEFYASHIEKLGLSDVQSVFGPAYKGIPLCVTTAQSLYEKHQIDLGFTFNRKEAKTHGDKGEMVGYKLQPGDSVILVEDVITAGTTLRQMVPILRDDYGVSVKGVIISVDRCERGTREVTAAVEAEQDLNISVFPIVTVHEIISYLSSQNTSNYVLSADLKSRMLEYLNEYGA